MIMAHAPSLQHPRAHQHSLTNVGTTKSTQCTHPHTHLQTRKPRWPSPCPSALPFSSLTRRATHSHTSPHMSPHTCGHGGHVGQVPVALHCHTEALQLLDQVSNCLLHAASQLHGVGARRHDLHALCVQSKRYRGRRSGQSWCVGRPYHQPHKVGACPLPFCPPLLLCSRSHRPLLASLAIPPPCLPRSPLHPPSASASRTNPPSCSLVPAFTAPSPGPPWHLPFPPLPPVPVPSPPPHLCNERR